MIGASDASYGTPGEASGMHTPIDDPSNARPHALELMPHQQMGATSMGMAMGAQAAGSRYPQQQQQQQLQPHQMRAPTNFHLGHRRSSSVPLSSEVYPGYPFNPAFANQAQNPFLGQHQATVAQGRPDPFNFANPNVANIQHQQQGQEQEAGNSGIALPSLPIGINGFRPSWFQGQGGFGTNNTNDNLSSNVQALTLSRAGSPEMGMAGFGGTGTGAGADTNAPSQAFPRLSAFGISLSLMGARAAHTHQLGQLGRRASSTQPSLQHQLNSGLFASTFDSTGFNGDNANWDPRTQFTGFTFAGQQAQQGFDGFVGAVAEGFTNPFAPSSNDSQTNGGSQSNPGSAGGGWYDAEPVDPMTPVYPQSAHPNSVGVHMQQGQSVIIDPTFSFGSASSDAHHATDPPSPKSAPQTALVGNNSFAHQQGADFALVQPVPLRKTPSANANVEIGPSLSQPQPQAPYVADQSQHYAYNVNMAGDPYSVGVAGSTAYGSQASHSGEAFYSQQQAYMQSTQTSEASTSSLEGSPDMVASMELLDGAVHVAQNGASSQQQQSYAGQYQAQNPTQVATAYSSYPEPQAQLSRPQEQQGAYYAYDGYAQAHAQGQGPMHMSSDGQQGQGPDGQGPRFSFSDYVVGSPFVAASAVAN